MAAVRAPVRAVACGSGTGTGTGTGNGTTTGTGTGRGNATGTGTGTGTGRGNATGTGTGTGRGNAGGGVNAPELEDGDLSDSEPSRPFRPFPSHTVTRSAGRPHDDDARRPTRSLRDAEQDRYAAASAVRNSDETSADLPRGTFVSSATQRTANIAISPSCSVAPRKSPVMPPRRRR